jgi:hypothetical protein
MDHAELGASLEEGGDLRAVNDVFAGQAGEVGAGAADLLLLDRRYPKALRTEVPSHKFAGFAGTEHKRIIDFRGGHRDLLKMGGSSGSSRQALMASANRLTVSHGNLNALKTRPYTTVYNRVIKATNAKI